MDREKIYLDLSDVMDVIRDDMKKEFGEKTFSLYRSVVLPATISTTKKVTASLDPEDILKGKEDFKELAGDVYNEMVDLAVLLANCQDCSKEETSSLVQYTACAADMSVRIFVDSVKSELMVPFWSTFKAVST